MPHRIADRSSHQAKRPDAFSAEMIGAYDVSMKWMRGYGTSRDGLSSFAINLSRPKMITFLLLTNLLQRADQVRLELGDVHVQGTVEAERRREGRDHLRQETVEVGVGRPGQWPSRRHAYSLLLVLSDCTDSISPSDIKHIHTHSSPTKHYDLLHILLRSVHAEIRSAARQAGLSMSRLRRQMS